MNATTLTMRRSIADAEGLLRRSSLRPGPMAEFDNSPLTRREVWALSMVAELLALLKKQQVVDETPAHGANLDGQRFDFGGLVVDCSLRQVTVRGSVVNLTPMEYELLVTLAQRDGKPVSVEEISQRVWRKPYDPKSRAVCQMIGEVRRKIEEDPRNPRYLRTVREYGYRLTSQSSEG